MFATFSDPDPGQKGRIFFYSWALLLHAAGVLCWCTLLDWGRESSFLLQDWYTISYPRLSFIQAALRQGAWPLHIADSFSLHYITHRFLTFPDLLVSPQVILLLWMDVTPFMVCNLVLSLLVGGAGLVYLARRLRLSALAFTFLFILFNFNGHIIAHIAIGHLTWTAYFLFPWFLVLVLRLYDPPDPGWRWVACVAGYSLTIVVQGGYHHFIWSLIFLMMLALVLPRRAWRILQAALFSVLLNAFRLAPCALNLGLFEDQFITGYADLLSIWRAMTDSYWPGAQIPLPGATGFYGAWEFTLYAGWVGAVCLALACAGFIYRSMHECLGGGAAQPDRYSRYLSLLVPAGGMTLISLDGVFRALRSAVPLPIFTGERMVTRLVILGFIAVVMLAAVQLQRLLNARRSSPWLPAACAAGLVVIARDLLVNARQWQLSSMVGIFAEGHPEQRAQQVIRLADPVYSDILLAGLVLSLLAAGFLAWKAIPWRRAFTKRSIL